MLKNNFLTILILSFFFSIKSLAVPRPEYINWIAQPRDFIISLYEGVFEGVTQDFLTQNEANINDLASSIDGTPKSRYEMFWLFINSSEYQKSRWAKQKKEYSVYYKYVTSGTVEKNSYYVAKESTKADIGIKGKYTFGVAMAVRDFNAIFDPRSIEYREMWNFVPRQDRSSSNNISGNILTDIDDNNYKTIKIGNQVWMAENLRTTKYNDGTQISQFIDGFKPDGAYHWYNNDITLKKIGALYNWHAVDTDKLCPLGWHVPSRIEWEELFAFVDFSSKEPDRLAYHLRSKKGWITVHFGQEVKKWTFGLDSFGFSAVGSGVSFNDNPKDGMYFKHIGEQAYWWARNKSYLGSDNEKLYFYNINWIYSVISKETNYKGNRRFLIGLCVRCVKD